MNQIILILIFYSLKNDVFHNILFIAMWISVSINLNTVYFTVKKITVMFTNFIVFYRNAIVIK